MSSGYILIVAILLLGGIIATVGDRLGTRVGKARLSLFNLRPKKTAVLVTILTGSIISGSTLGILFAVSDQLRTGVFQLGTIQNQLKTAREELEKARGQKGQAERELSRARQELQTAKTQQTTAQKRLAEINRSLNVALERQAKTAAQLQQVADSFLKAQNQLKTVSQQATVLRSDIDQLQSDKQALVRQQEQVIAQISQRDEEINKRNQLIASRDQEIASRDRVINQRAERLKSLEEQQTELEQAVQTLEQYYQYYQARYESLRQGNVALFRGQVLASGVLRVLSPTAARQAADQLLRLANRNALQLTQPGSKNGDEQIIQITKAEVDRLINQIDDGRDYVMRVLSAGNYILGEKNVQVVADATPNQVVFRSGDLVASTSIDSATMTPDQIRKRIELLLAASEFRGRGAGILAEGVQVGEGGSIPAIALNTFIDQLREYKQPLEVEAIAADVIYTAGPLKVQLVASQSGQIVLKTG